MNKTERNTLQFIVDMFDQSQTYHMEQKKAAKNEMFKAYHEGAIHAYSDVIIALNKFLANH